MSEDAHKSENHMSDQNFAWSCPVCKKHIVAWTKKAIQDTIEHHEYKHRRELEEARKQNPESAIVKFEAKNYDILELTRTDVGFLRTRHIKVDEQDTKHAFEGID